MLDDVVEPGLKKAGRLVEDVVAPAKLAAERPL